MKSYLKNIGCQILCGSQVPKILNKTVFRGHLTILMYHGVVAKPLSVPDWCFIEENVFQRQVQYLKKHFEVLPLYDAVKNLMEGKVRTPTVVLTFDDGFQNNYDIAYPILKNERIPAAIFLTTGFVDTNETAWFCRLNQALTETSLSFLVWHGQTLDLSSPLKRGQALVVIQKWLKTLPQPELMVELEGVTRELGYNISEPISLHSPFRMLNSDAIREMVGSGLIEFGAHTHSHAILSCLTKKNKREEIIQSVSAVSQLTNYPCRLFAYPNGQKQDYDQESIETLKECGIQFSVTTNSGSNQENAHPLELKRYGVGAGITHAYFQVKVHHLIDRIRQTIQWN